ncbi:MAG: hypothetical protein IPL27_27130 [Lewinellaceae bacterium]|nr:hypothetical protein [Lewinellaceae bacterium]
MPLEVRQTLLAWLEREHPETHYRLREGLHRLLAQNPPPEGSAAYDDYAMNLALNEWLYTRDAERKKELQRDIAARLAAGQQADFMVLRMLDPGRSLTPEQFEVPADWKKHLREKGFAFLNPRRAWWWAVPIWVVLCGLALWWQPERVGCGGLNASYQGKEYCIENFEEWAVFREMLVQDKLLADDLTSADSIADFLLGVGWENRIITQDNAALRAAIEKEANMFVSPSPANAKSRRTEIYLEVFAKGAAPTDLVDNKPYLDSISFLQNAAIAYFNEGAKIHNAYSSMWETVERSGQKPVGANYRSRMEACAYFSRAQEINDLLPDTAQLWYVRDAAKCSLPVVRQSSKPAPPTLQDITISGQLNNAATKRSLYLNEWTATKIEAKGLPPANLSRGAFFSIRVPGNRKTSVQLNITSPGFEPLRITIRPADFGKDQTIELVPLQKCFASLRAEGVALTHQKNSRKPSKIPWISRLRETNVRFEGAGRARFNAF